MILGLYELATVYHMITISTTDHTERSHRLNIIWSLALMIHVFALMPRRLFHQTFAHKIDV